MNTHDEMIAVIQAHKEGKAIEYSSLLRSYKEWKLTVSPEFNFGDFEYRIAQPKPEKVKVKGVWFCSEDGNVVYVAANSKAYDRYSSVWKEVEVE